MVAKRPGGAESDDGPPQKRQQVSSPLPLAFEDCTPWTLAEVSASEGVLPPLPRPADPSLEEQAFVHVGCNPRRNYEQLEWLGDAILEHIATNLIYLTFRDSLKAGRLSQLREVLIRNKTLAKYLREYGLESRAVLPSEYSESDGRPGLTKKPKKPIEKVHGDIFEAYVGAIRHADPENGMRTVTQWMKALWGQEIKDDLRKLAISEDDIKSNLAMAAHPKFEQTGDASSATSVPGSGNVTLNPKVLLHRAIGYPGVRIEYKDMPRNAGRDKMGHEIFSIGAYFTGGDFKDELLAVGSARQKAEASSKAAQEVLRNRKLLKKYEKAKEDYMKTKEAKGTDGSA